MVSTERSNEDYPWHDFDPDSYLEDNYAVLRDEDRQMVELVRDFFAAEFANDPNRTGRCGIDVGTGANLYPALAMLPFVERLTLYDYSLANVRWLIRQHAADWPTWSPVWSQFWHVFSEHDCYAELDGHPKAELARCVDVIQGSVFDLAAYPQRWDIGTMFFVAESITSQKSEFAAAVDHFLAALRTGAPFAIGFMEESSGYHVAGKSFPATPVGIDEVRQCLRRHTSDVHVRRFDHGDNPLRDGYSGTIVAYGRVSGTG
ncbi:SCO2525 family SAM-dependent methyltransferase [Actinophytocola sp.]|uniref:SCO2525 family SAM-dependent methyltransferase n=1 Tax=Actinophytocola sp. TaxID=1872138 RepID=UPI002D7FFEAA|nr:SCO2525 family SAM-dependent methyltransferase [Actinophytocola sp.]HET9140216.1 SCO2525 family SAM-dependent methyltransferase [Actinophytocola sp.]